MSDQNDDKKNEQQTSMGDAIISRRKLAYVAPLFVSRKMIYRAVGCGKSDPRLRQCSSSPSGS